jgi:hypothetical protein
MNTILRSALITLTLVLTLPACKKLIKIDAPVGQVISTEVFKTDSSALSAVLGIYSDMMVISGSYSSCYTTFYPGLSANELRFFTPGVIDEVANCTIGIGTHSVLNSVFWNPVYKHIYAANLCYEKLNESLINPYLRDALTGEVLFIRAFCYFNLVNLFGDVPLITSTDYRINTVLPRTSVQLVYDQMINDLMNAVEKLPETYTGSNRVRPTKWAASALLSRVMLYQQRWQQAADAATKVISQNLFALTPLTGVFLKNSTEAIFQLMPVNQVWNTWEAKEMLPASANETPKYLLTERLLNAFETGDNRRISWVGTRVFNGNTVYYPAKYKVYGNSAPITEFYMVLRLAEQYLIRAEARAHLADINGGLADLNVIRRRAGLTDASATNKDHLLQLIERERQSELFAEWGHRWFDLKRTNRINAVMSAIHPASWSENDALYPIPFNQLDFNPYLTQNPGY